MEYAPLESLLAETYGTPLLSYLSAVDEELIERRLAGEPTLPEPAEAVLTGPLATIAQQIAPDVARHEGLGSAFFLDLLATRPDPDGPSVGNALRIAAGGSIEDCSPQDPQDALLQHLLSVAVDAYPLYLAPTLPFRPPHVSFFRHPLRGEIERALLADAEPLSRLFPDDDPGLGRKGYIVTSLGRGFSLQSVMFAEMVLGSAWASVAMSVHSPSPGDLIKAVERNVTTLRRAVLGDSPQVPALVAFTGFKLGEARTIETPWGPLRPITKAERRAAPPSLEGAVQTTLQDGRQVQVAYAGELVLESTVPYRIRIEPWPSFDSGAFSWPQVDERQTLQSKIERLQLTALLGVDRPPETLLVARPSWVWTEDPLGHGSSMSWWDPKSNPGFIPYELSVDESAGLQEWASLIDKAAHPSIRVAVRGCLSAAHARADPADRLVDAVIVWENLFGTSEGEPRLRISAAMAWLLGQDGKDRRRLQLELKKLYDARSKVVHGGDVSPEELGTSALSALSYAVQILKSLFRERPEVLGLGDGASRSLAVLLDDHDQ